MKIGRQQQPGSAISAANADTILVRGRDLCRELIGRISFTDHVWLMITGEFPSSSQRQVLDATLVAIAEHGLVPSVVASRMTLAAAPEALQGAVAAGVLGCGSVILGASSQAAELFADIVARSHGSTIEVAARAALSELRAARRVVPGYGHPLHKTGDPRAARLLELAGELGVAAQHVESARAVEKYIPEVVGKPLVMNVSAAIGAMLLDCGYPLLAVRGVPILARTAGLIANLLEEQQRPIGFALSYGGSSAIRYDGQMPAGFVPSDGSGSSG